MARLFLSKNHLFAKLTDKNILFLSIYCFNKTAVYCNAFKLAAVYAAMRLYTSMEVLCRLAPGFDYD